MRTLKIVLVLLLIGVSVYGLTTQDFSFAPASTLLLGIFLAILGVEEFRNNRSSGNGLVFLTVSVFVLVVGVYSL